MCGIFGFVSQQPTSYHQLEQSITKLARRSSSRGKDATGLVVILTDSIVAAKTAGDASRFFNSVEYRQLVAHVANKPMLAVIGHARLATHGAVIAHNTQPLIFEHIVGAHNGIITNYHTLALSSPRTKRDIPDQLDSELLFERINHDHHTQPIEPVIDTVLGEIQGTASVAIWSKKERTLSLATNFGSLYYTQTSTSSKQKQWFFASEERILHRSLNQDISTEKVTPHTIITFDTQTNHLPSDTVQSFVSPSQQWPKKRLKNKLSTIASHTIDYQKIERLQRCTNCILPITTPFIHFDDQGVCNYCRTHTPISQLGIEALRTQLAKLPSKKCLIAFSGGRDSAYGLHFLKRELNLDPVAFTYDWGMVSDLGRRNQARLLSQLEVEHVVVAADIEKKRAHIRQNILAWLQKPDIGMIPIFMSGDKTCEWHADQVQRDYNLATTFFCRGNSFEREEFKAGHCGVTEADPGGVIHHLAWKGKVQLAWYYLKQFLGNPAYLNTSLVDTMAGYLVTYLQSHHYFYLWHYIPWDERTIIDTLVNEYDWELPTDTTTTWRVDDGSPAFYNYIYYHWQGFTENDSFRSHQVRQGLLTRQRALELVAAENKPRPEALQWYFNALDLDGDAVLSAIDQLPTLY